MYIKTNAIANQLYVPYTQNVRGLALSARRLATGEKIPTAADGAGELGVAEKWEQRRRGTNKLIDGMTNSLGYFRSQDVSLDQVSEIMHRMSELTASALDVSKSTADRGALNTEFQALAQEFENMRSRVYNGISLFASGSYAIRADISTGGAAFVVVSGITIGRISFTNRNITQLTSAQTTLDSLNDRFASLAEMRARAGNNVNEVERVIDYTRTHVKELTESENAIRNVDIAIESGNFINKQVLLSASQSVLAQANGIVQSALQFLTS